MRAVFGASLEFDFPWGSWERYDVTDVAHSCAEAHHSFKEEEGEDTTDVIDDRVPSDESLLEDARKLTANPILRLALTQEGILRLFVRFVDNAANGVLDESVKPLLGNYDAFKADVNRDGYLAATQSTTQRFTPLVAALTSIPPEDAATWLRNAEPRLQDILREMGYANTTFQSILTYATANVLQILHRMLILKQINQVQLPYL